MIGLVPFDIFCKLCIVTSFWCVGLFINSQESDDLLYPVRRLADKLPEKIGKPIILCVNCMASIHGTLIVAAYFFFTGLPVSLFVQTVIPVIVVCSLLNGIVYVLHELLVVLMLKFKGAINLTNLKLSKDDKDE